MCNISSISRGEGSREDKKKRWVDVVTTDVCIIIVCTFDYIYLFILSVLVNLLTTPTTTRACRGVPASSNIRHGCSLLSCSMQHTYNNLGRCMFGQ